MKCELACKEHTLILNDTLVAMARNGIILLGVCAMLDMIPDSLRRRHSLAYAIAYGIALCFSGFVIQNSGWEIEGNIYLDTVTVLVSCSSVFFNAISSLMLVLTASLFRFYSGYGDVYSGIFAIVASACIGFAWKNKKCKAYEDISIINLAYLGVVITISEILIACLFSPYSIKDTLIYVAPYMLLVQPATTVALGVVLKHRIISLKVARALADSEDRFRHIVETSLEGIWTLDKDLKTNFLNSRMAELLGYNIDEVMGKSPLCFMLPDDNGDPKHNIALLKGENQQVHERRFVRKNGEILWALVSPQAIKNEQGDFTGSFAMLTDITNQKKLEADLRGSQESFRVMVESSPLATALLGDDSETVVFLNSTFTRLFGYTISEVPTLEHWWPKAYPDPDYRAKNMDLWQRVLRPMASPQALSEETESFVTCKDGSVRHIVWGRACSFGKCVFYGQDVTEHRVAEERLRQSEEKFSKFFMMIPYSAIIIRSSDGIIIDSNAAQGTISGYSKEEIIGNTSSGLDLWASLDRRKEFFDSLRDNNMVMDFEMVMRRKDGVLRDVTISALRMEINGEECLVALSRDVTDVNTLRRNMIQSEKMVSLGGVAAGVAHEINNPLGIILQAVSGCLRRLDPTLPASVREAESLGLDLVVMRDFLHRRNILMYLEAIKDAANRAAATVSSMLDFSRRSDSRLAANDLEALVRKSISLAEKDYDLKKQYDFKKISLEIQAAHDLPLIPCVANEIEQVILNLLRNAAQAMAEARTEAPAITVKLDYDDLKATIDVDDNGPGISPEKINRIFDPFFTTKPVGEGTGLGLSVSYFIITTLHGGSISVKSRVGYGTNFTITLPLNRHS